MEAKSGMYGKVTLYGVICSLDETIEPRHVQPFSRPWGAAIANFWGKTHFPHRLRKKVCMWRWRNSRAVNTWQNFFRSAQMEKSSKLRAIMQLRVNGKTAVVWMIRSGKLLMQTDLTDLLLIALPSLWCSFWGGNCSLLCRSLALLQCCGLIPASN